MPDVPVLVAGELLVDIVVRQGEPPQEHVGGSPANVAMGLARLGHRTHLATVVGADERGERCVAQVASSGASLVPGSMSNDQVTSTATATLDATGAASYAFDLHWDLADVPIPQGTGHVHTGSIATTLEPGQREVTRLLREVGATGTVSYDPNVRPSIMGRPEVVRARVEELVALSDVVKASDEDVAFLYPELPPSEVLRLWGDLGPALTVVTRGGDGVIWRVSHTGEESFAPASAGNVVDTVGAGDSFMAGLISGLLDAALLGGTSQRERLRSAGLAEVQPAIDRALRTSGITVTHAGAYAPTRDEL